LASEGGCVDTKGQMRAEEQSPSGLSLPIDPQEVALESDTDRIEDPLAGCAQ